MKIRLGFVSNSSSASFVIGKNFMTKKQIEEFSTWAIRFNEDEDTYESYIHEDEYYFFGEISIHESVKIKDFLKNIKVNPKYASQES